MLDKADKDLAVFTPRDWVVDLYVGRDSVGFDVGQAIKFPLGPTFDSAVAGARFFCRDEAL